MGRFLAMAAADGAQVILESHSDHVLNGVRRAVKDGVIAPEQVAIHFFAVRTEDGKCAQVISPLIDPVGTIDRWPTGFFDQFDKDTAALIDW
jgi:predicted ATPase